MGLVEKIKAMADKATKFVIKKTKFNKNMQVSFGENDDLILHEKTKLTIYHLMNQSIICGKKNDL